MVSLQPLGSLNATTDFPLDNRLGLRWPLEDNPETISESSFSPLRCMIVQAYLPSAERIASVGVEMFTLQLPCTCCNRRVLLQQLMLTTVAIVSKGRGDHYSLLLRVFLQWLGITSGNLFRYKPIGPLNEKESCPQPIGYNINFGVTYFTGPTLPTTSAEWKH